MKKLLTFLFAVFFAVPVFAACTSGQIDVTGDGSNCQTVKFSVGTTSTNSFKFTMSAKGTFYVDCGNGGTLTSTASDVTNNTKITRSGTTVATYTCTWGTAGTQTIRFGGTATNYSTGTTTAAISFYMSGGTQAKISSISGNLSTMFPYKAANAATGAQPRFYQTFYNATSLTSIPDTLFASYTKAATYMFNYTFAGCSGLTSIPENLFVKVGGAADGLFQSTFQNCTGLTSIPANLFASFTTGAQYMFAGTFLGCTGLTSIPENLFFPNISSVSGQKSMFHFTFCGCTGLTTIPENLFAKITSGAQLLFYHTFYNCSGLISIPENLFFPNVTSVTGQTQMFHSTFLNCTGLTSIPENLFAKVTSGAQNMFENTFSGCTKLGGYIPKSTFEKLIANNSPTASSMWRDTFTNTKLVSSCPSGTTTINTTYKGMDTRTYQKWGNYAMCEEVTGLDCSAGYYLPANANACSICPINNICSGGTYTPGANNQGITACASGTFAPTGSTVCYPHILHVGDDKIYMNSTKQTTPSLNFRIGNDVFFINMTTTRTKMNKDSDHYFHVQWGNNDYYMCDNTTCPQ